MLRILDSWRYVEGWVGKLAIGGKCGGVEESREYFQLTIVAPLALLLDGGCS